jgi:hypothetical protein
MFNAKIYLNFKKFNCFKKLIAKWLKTLTQYSNTQYLPKVEITLDGLVQYSATKLGNAIHSRAQIRQN